jgi:hypothetical protein
MSLIFLNKSVDIGDQKLHGSISELENAVIIFFWVGKKTRLGSLSATLPDKTSSQLLGDRDELISRIIGEKVASSTGKIALVSTSLTKDFDGRLVLRLLNELLGELIEKS